MRYFKNEKGEVFAYEEGSVVKSGLTKLTELEVEEVLNPPEPTLTVLEQIVQLESSITPRNLRGAMLGDEFAKAKIASVDSQVVLLRASLVR